VKSEIPARVVAPLVTKNAERDQRSDGMKRNDEEPGVIISTTANEAQRG
jgi:hypothetical protein